MLSESSLSNPHSPGGKSQSNSSVLKLNLFGNSRIKSICNSPSQISLYKEGSIPTHNLKLEQFLEIVCGSLMTKEEIKEQTKNFFLVLETQYTEKIKSLNFKI